MNAQMPQQVSEYAPACLEALSASGVGNKISLGGAFGLMHYFEYRPTYDVDAWWGDSATFEDKQKVVQVIETALRPYNVGSYGGSAR
jgi:hypothetical protein